MAALNDWEKKVKQDYWSQFTYFEKFQSHARLGASVKLQFPALFWRCLCERSFARCQLHSTLGHTRFPIPEDPPVTSAYPAPLAVLPPPIKGDGEADEDDFEDVDDDD